MVTKSMESSLAMWRDVLDAPNKIEMEKIRYNHKRIELARQQLDQQKQEAKSVRVVIEGAEDYAM